MIGSFHVPLWWECQWRRISCRRNSCTFCGRLNALERLIGDSEIPNESAVAAEKQLSETIQYQAKDLGIPAEYLFGGHEIIEDDFDEDGYLMEDEREERISPEPEAFLLYRFSRRWSRLITGAIARAEGAGAAWAKTEAAQDLLWYAAMLPVKIYRQLSTKKEIRNAPDGADEERAETEEFLKIESTYSGYVLREIAAIIDFSLKTLSEDRHVPDSEQYILALRRFNRFRPFINEIVS